MLPASTQRYLHREKETEGKPEWWEEHHPSVLVQPPWTVEVVASSRGVGVLWGREGGGGSDAKVDHHTELYRHSLKSADPSSKDINYRLTIHHKSK